MRTFEYRLYPHTAQARLLLACLIESRHLYNAMLETVKAQYEQDGTLIQKSLSVRTHICTSCDLIADRDVNAAQNILFKAGSQPSGANVSQ